jgi:hypothetical protein
VPSGVGFVPSNALYAAIAVILGVRTRRSTHLEDREKRDERERTPETTPPRQRLDGIDEHQE